MLRLRENTDMKKKNFFFCWKYNSSDRIIKDVSIQPCRLLIISTSTFRRLPSISTLPPGSFVLLLERAAISFSFIPDRDLNTTWPEPSPEQCACILRGFFFFLTIQLDLHYAPDCSGFNLPMRWWWLTKRRVIICIQQSRGNSVLTIIPFAWPWHTLIHPDFFHLLFIISFNDQTRCEFVINVTSFKPVNSRITKQPRSQKTSTVVVAEHFLIIYPPIQTVGLEFRSIIYNVSEHEREFHIKWRGKGY